MVNKILVAMDNSSMSEYALSQALSLGQATDASLLLLHVLAPTEGAYIEMPEYTGYYPLADYQPYFNRYQEQLKAFEQRDLILLQSWTDQATEAGLNAEYRLMMGEPGPSICKLAKTWGAELIVVGSRGHRGLTEVFLGSVSNYVAHYAPCSVLVVHDRQSSHSHSSQEVPAEMSFKP